VNNTRRAKTATHIIRLAIPLSLAQLAHILISFSDTVMIGRLDATALAGSSLTGQIESFLIVTATAICQIASVLVARESSRLGRLPIKLMESAQILGLILGVTSAGIMLGLAPFVPHLGQPASVTTAVETYWTYCALSILPAVFNSANKMILDGAHAAVLATLVVFVMVGLNILLNGVFMFGWCWGFEMGLEGAGIATLLSRLFGAVATALLIVHLRKNKDPSPINAQMAEAPDASRVYWMRKLVSLGLPIGLMTGAEFGAFSLVGILSGHFGESALAAHRIGMQITSITYVTAVSIAQAAALRASVLLRPELLESLRQTLRTGIAVVMAVMTLASLIIIVLHDQIAALFSTDLSVIKQAGDVLLIIGLYQIVDGAQASGLVSLRALHDTRIPSLFCVACYWLIALPVGTVLAYSANWGLSGLWMGLLCGLSVQALFAHMRLQKKTGRRMEKCRAALIADSG
jgi:MATE family multidrug resistance protein